MIGNLDRERHTMDQVESSNALESILTETLAQLEEVTQSKQSLAFYSNIDHDQSKPIKVTGIAIAEGDWNGVRYTALEIKAAAASLKGLPIRVEHSKTREFRSDSVGTVTNAEWDDTLKALKFAGKITDPTARELIVSGTFKAVSVQTFLDKVLDQGIVMAKNLLFTELSLVEKPACLTCQIFHWESLSKKDKCTGACATVVNSIEIKPSDNMNDADLTALKEEIMGKVETIFEDLYSKNIDWTCPVCASIPNASDPLTFTKEEMLSHMKTEHPHAYIAMQEAGMVDDSGLLATDAEFVSWSSSKWKESEKTRGGTSRVDNVRIGLSTSAGTTPIDTEVNELSKPKPDPKLTPTPAPDPVVAPVVAPVPVPVTAPVIAPVIAPVVAPVLAPVPVPVVVPPAPVVVPPVPVVAPPVPVPTPAPVVAPVIAPPVVVERIIERIIERPAAPVAPVVVPAVAPVAPVAPIPVPTPAPVVAPVVAPVLAPVVPVPAPVPVVAAPVVAPIPAPTPDPDHKDLSVGELIYLLYRRKDEPE